MNKMKTANNWTIEITGSDDACDKCTRKNYVHNACMGCEHSFSFKFQAPMQFCFQAPMQFCSDHSHACGGSR